MRFYIWLLKVFLGAFLGIVAGLFLGIIAHGFLIDRAHAATYNLLFNNVEQGANSTSTPSVTVSGGKATKDTGVSADEAQSTTSAPVIELPHQIATPAAATPAAGTQVAQIPAASLEASPRSYPFRLGLSGHVLQPSIDSNEAMWGAGASLSYFPIEDFGISALAGTVTSGQYYWGGEIEAVPVRLTLFGLRNFAELGILAGGTTLGAYNGVGATGHLGARATLNFGERMGVTAAVRTNVTDRNQYTYVMAETGLTVRF